MSPIDPPNSGPSERLIMTVRLDELAVMCAGVGVCGVLHTIGTSTFHSPVRSDGGEAGPGQNRAAVAENDDEPR